jgi:uncharacterized membrane protein YbaN (DUF454 family)
LTKKIIENRLIRYLFILGGILSVIIAIFGIFLPLIPTTPLLLLSAYFFGKSSEKFHSRLINNKWFGSYIKNYQAGKGIPLHSKITAILSMWLVIGASIVWGTDILFVRIILALVNIGVTIHLLRMPTFRKTKKYKIELNEE